MIILLVLVPVLAIVAGLLLYTQTGKKEILRFDSVQFFNAFILAPAVYIWFKSFLYFLLQSEFPELISQPNLLFWDSVYSVIFLFLYAFMVIHSLTKSFQLKQDKDPLYDLLEHSEYYHLWVTHTVIFVVGMIIALLLAALNAWLNLPWPVTQFQFYGVLVVGLIMSGLIFKAFLISDFGDFRFVRLMKLISAFFLVLHIVVYAIYEPVFSGAKTMYWFQFATFFGLSIIGLVHESQPIKSPLHQRVSSKFRWVWRWSLRELKRLSGRFQKQP